MQAFFFINGRNQTRQVILWFLFTPDFGKIICIIVESIVTWNSCICIHILIWDLNWWIIFFLLALSLSLCIGFESSVEWKSSGSIAIDIDVYIEIQICCIIANKGIEWVGART
jgi:hypothetical protein